MSVSLIIPTLNEEETIHAVLSAVPRQKIDEIIVVDGGSTDQTVSIAAQSDVKIIHEERRGYGQACATGADVAEGDILVFMDADGADDPAQITLLLDQYVRGKADLILGSRLSGEIAEGAMPWHQWFGNWLSALIIRLLYGIPLTDLSPFRAIRASSLNQLSMKEMTYGWPTEMIVKAIRAGCKIIEIPVSYRPRAGGKSKISGTFRGTVFATYHILWTIIKFRYFKTSKTGNP
jgi:glycosyltransferase involved in cell wall biosynthesis